VPEPPVREPDPVRCNEVLLCEEYEVHDLVL
jgi:hypothetical protein